MHILIAGPLPYRSIPERFEGIFFLDSLIQKVAENGDDVVLLTYDARLKRDIEVKKNNVTLHVCKVIKHGNVRAALNFWPEIRKMSAYIKKIDADRKIDVFHAHWCYEYAAACLKVDAQRTIVTLHDWPDIVCPMFHKYYWNQRQKLGNQMISKANHITAVSPYIYSFAREKNKIASMEIIPNSISITKGEERKPHDTQDSLVFLAVNNGFSKRKNVETIILAFDKLRKKYSSVQLLLCGADYEMYGPAYKWCEENNVCTDGIEFMGAMQRETLTHVYNRADVLVHASREESFGLTLIEAMENGCSVIAGKNSGAIPWILQEGQCGLLINIESVTEMVDAMETMMNCSTREKYVEAGYKRVTDFDEEKVVPAYLNLYNNIAEYKK